MKDIQKGTSSYSLDVYKKIRCETLLTNKCKYIYV